MATLSKNRIEWAVAFAPCGRCSGVMCGVGAGGVGDVAIASAAAAAACKATNGDISIDSIIDCVVLTACGDLQDLSKLARTYVRALNCRMRKEATL